MFESFFGGLILGEGGCIRDFDLGFGISRDGRAVEVLRFHLHSISKTCM